MIDSGQGSGQDSMIDHQISSIDTGNCGNCKKLSRANEKLRKENKKLQVCLQQDILKDLSSIGMQLQNLKALAKDYKIQIDDLTSALAYALDMTFKIKSKALVEKGKSILQMIENLFINQSKKKPANKIEPRLPISQPNQANIQEDSNKKPVKKQQKQQSFSIWLDQSKVTKLKNQEKLVEQRDKVLKGDRELNKQKIYIYQEQSIPLVWEQSSAFKIKDKIITKLYNDEYKKMCSTTSLPKKGSHKIKFQMIKQGTVAFGIVLQQYKNGRMIDERKGALKYLSFENGGGLIKLLGEQILSSKQIHLEQQQKLQIIYNAQKLTVTFINPNLHQPLTVELGARFKDKQLYFFMQMKHHNCAIKMM